ncbi:MAG: M48 family metalloprotease [Oscillatoriales cyanobacterium RM2_1_1]|nr:M48 family metalloprotease [Oscillatoriales cyanobacterium RM2_1_1]
MTRKRITLSLLMGLSLLSSNVLLLKENSALAKSVTPLERTSKTSLVITQVDNSSPETGVNPESDFFKQAEAEFNVLGEYGKDLYVLYRLVEKLARANNLDERNWRFRLVNQYEINASASELNLLTFYAGLIDQLHGDYEAIACIVGHEMAHHEKNHIPLKVKLADEMERLKQEADQELLAEVQQNQKGSRNVVGGFIGGMVDRVVGTRGLASATGRTLDQSLDNMDAAERQQAQKRAKEIYEEKLAQLNQEFSAKVQEQELESDRFGYLYIARAGLDPQGCFRAMDVLNDLPTSHLPGITHPSTPERIQKLKAIQAEFSTANLVAEGKANLQNSPTPLKYAVSRDGQSIRIESRHNRNINDVL